MRQSDRSIGDELRAQARAFDPAPPGDLNRRIRSGLAAVEVPANRGVAEWFRRPVVAMVVVGAMLAGAVIYMQTRPARELARTMPPSSRTTVAHPGGGTSATFGSANLVALTERWVEQPLQGEVDNLLADLERTRGTVARVLPAAVKRARATTVKVGTQGV
jgi:hypothetical protein